MGFGPIDRLGSSSQRARDDVRRLLTRGGNPVGAISSTRRWPRSRRGAAATGCSPSPATSSTAATTGAITDLTGTLEFALGAIAPLAHRPALRLHHHARMERPLLQLTERHGSSRFASSALVSTSFRTQVIIVEDETGEQLMVDSSDGEFRRRLREAGGQACGGAQATTLPGVDITKSRPRTTAPRSHRRSRKRRRRRCPRLALDAARPRPRAAARLGLLVRSVRRRGGAPRGSPRKGSCRPRLHGTRAASHPVRARDGDRAGRPPRPTDRERGRAGARAP